MRSPLIRDTRGTRIVLGVLLITSFTLAVVDSRSGDENSPLAPVRSAFASALAPAVAGAEAVTSPVTVTADAVGNGRESAERIRALSARNAVLTARLSLLMDNQRANADAADAVAAARTAGVDGFDVLGARVIAAGADRGYSWTVAIDAGSDDGVVPDTTVLTSAGLVGRVVDVTERAATVLLLVDPLSSVGVRLERSGAIGTLDGRGSSEPRLTLFDRHADVEPGDRLVTFGSAADGPFVAGIPVGTVTAVQRHAGAGPSVTVEPHAGFGSLDAVAVVVPDRATAQAAAP